MNKIVCFLLAGFILSCKNNNTDEHQQANDKQKALTQTLDSIYKQGSFNGFGVAVVTADSILYQKGFGFADRALGVSYNANTRQPIASVSKTVIGIALLKAQEMGMLKLDEPVNKYLPFKVQNPLYPQINITIKQLATHTSTINDVKGGYLEKAYVLDKDVPNVEFQDYDQDFNPASADIGMEEFLQSLLASGGLNYNKGIYNPYKPGEYFEYSNLGSALAALVLEKATGMGYDEFVLEYVFKPLNMQSSSFYGKNMDYKDHSLLYSTVQNPLPYYHCITYPDGGLVTSPADMALYLQELIRGYQGKGKLLHKESYTELFTAYLKPENFIDERQTNNPYNDEYNSGLFMGFSPKGYIGHTGGDPGVSSLLFFDPKTGVGRFLMVNTDINDKKGNDAFYTIWDKLLMLLPNTKNAHL